MRSRIARVLFAASMLGAAPSTVLAQTQFTFKDPGTYVLRAVASDGAVFTYGDVTVSVTR